MGMWLPGPTSCARLPRYPPQRKLEGAKKNSSPPGSNGSRRQNGEQRRKFPSLFGRPSKCTDQWNRRMVGVHPTLLPLQFPPSLRFHRQMMTPPQTTPPLLHPPVMRVNRHGYDRERGSSTWQGLSERKKTQCPLGAMENPLQWPPSHTNPHLPLHQNQQLIHPLLLQKSHVPFQHHDLRM